MLTTGDTKNSKFHNICSQLWLTCYGYDYNVQNSFQVEQAAPKEGERLCQSKHCENNNPDERSSSNDTNMKSFKI